jgi:chromosome segregation ATPase
VNDLSRRLQEVDDEINNLKKVISKWKSASEEQKKADHQKTHDRVSKLTQLIQSNQKRTRELRQEIGRLQTSLSDYNDRVQTASKRLSGQVKEDFFNRYHRGFSLFNAEDLVSVIANVSKAANSGERKRLKNSADQLKRLLKRYETTIKTLTAQGEERNFLRKSLAFKPVVYQKGEVIQLESKLKVYTNKFAELMKLQNTLSEQQFRKELGEKGANQIAVLEPANKPKRPVPPRLGLVLLITFAGVFLIIGIREIFFDNSLKSEIALERYLQSRVLGVLPRFQ